MGTADQETFAVLANARWGEIGVRLTAYAVARARQCRWLSGDPDVLPGGMTPEQIAADVVAKTISGERRFDARRGELEPWLRSQVRSEVANLLRSAEHLRSVPLPDDDAALDETASRFMAAEIDGEPVTPETMFLAAEEAADRQDLLFAAADEDEELVDVVLVGLDIEDVRPRYLAAALGITTRQVEVRLRRLGRRARKVKVS